MADPHTDHRADIYAFGVVAYQLLTGQPPFTGNYGAGDRRGTDNRDADGPEDASARACPRDSRTSSCAPSRGGRPIAGRAPRRCSPAWSRSLPRRARPHGRPHLDARADAASLPRWRWHSCCWPALPRPGAPRPRGTRAPARPTDPAHPRPRDGDRAGAVAGRATRRLRVGAHAVARDPGAPGGRRIPDRGGRRRASVPSGGHRGRPTAAASCSPHRAASRSCPRSAGRRVSSCRTRRIRTTDPWGSSGLAHAWRAGRRTGNPSPSSGATRLYLQDLAGGSPRMLAQGGQMHSLAWSPDGRWIACVLGNRQAQQPGFLFANGGAATLGLIPASGGEPKPLSEDAYYSASPVLGARWQIADLHFQPGRRSGPLPDAAPAGRQTRGGAIAAHQRPRGRSRSASPAMGEGSCTRISRRRRTRIRCRSRTRGAGLGAQRRAGDSRQPGDRGPRSLARRPLARLRLRPASGNQDIYRMRLPDGEPERLTDDDAEEFWPDVVTGRQRDRVPRLSGRAAVTSSS